MEAKTHDVFLSYNSEDGESVEKIAVTLADQIGLKPWLDKWELIPGEKWLRALQRGLTFSKSCAVFVGKSGEGPWQREEVNAALDLQVNQKDFRVIPVLLAYSPAKPELPLFIKGNTWVDFKRKTFEDALWFLECGISGKPPGRGRPAVESVQKTSQPDPVPQVDPATFIVPGGAISVNSRFYISRPADEEVLKLIKKPRGLVTLQGPRQIGKTSLILRTHVTFQQQESERVKSVFIDFQSFPDKSFKSLDAVWERIVHEIAMQCDCDTGSEEVWHTKRSYDWNLSRFLDRIFQSGKSPSLVLCMDEVDRVVSYKIKEEFFRSVRYFWNRGAHDPTWERIRWLLSSSSEPRFFIENLSESPFNVGQIICLSNFTHKETVEFARRHGLVCDEPMTERIISYTGGRPFLVHKLLYNMALYPHRQEEFFESYSAGSGIFRTFLNHYLKHLQEDTRLAEAMKQVITGKGCRDLKMANCLAAAGLIKYDENNDLVCVGSLYADFFSRKL